MPELRRLAPLVVLGVAIAAAYALGVQRQFSWSALAAHQTALRAFVAARPAASASGYVAIYALAVGLSIPGGAVLTVTGGLLFGVLLGTALAVTGATLGAIGLFLVARYALFDLLSRRTAPLMVRLRPGLERDGFSYLLALRLLPVVPFWLVNLAPALIGMRLAPYAAATFLGIIPGGVVFASIGAGVGDILAHGGTPDLSRVLSARILLPLAGLSVLALAPVAWRRWRDRHG
jgi:uncharacterized membrane protein YdjX (TVP38/TMEM64 family)